MRHQRGHDARVESHCYNPFPSTVNSKQQTLRTDHCRTESSCSPEPIWAALQFRNWEVSSILLRLPGATISFTEKRSLLDQREGLLRLRGCWPLPWYYPLTHCLHRCMIGKEVLLWGHGLCCVDTTEEFQPDLPSSAHSCFCHQGPVSPDVCVCVGGTGNL